jgi:hypothetical protein
MVLVGLPGAFLSLLLPPLRRRHYRDNPHIVSEFIQIDSGRFLGEFIRGNFPLSDEPPKQTLTHIKYLSGVADSHKVHDKNLSRETDGCREKALAVTKIGVKELGERVF